MRFPDTEGFQEHVAVLPEPELTVCTFRHPGTRFLFTKNRILPETFVVTVIVSRVPLVIGDENVSEVMLAVGIE